MLRQFISERFAGDDFVGGLAHESGSSAAGLMTEGGEKFFARDGGGAALHNHETAGDICNVSGFERRSATGERNRVSGKDRVAGTRDVHSLVASVDGNLRQAVSGLKKRHAIAASCNEKRLQFHF